ncbi:MAG TPA: hypothetical protein VM285_15675, partial [Polyangia bacterium]|nr:hypothetical protein [Polyangia bacterium]
VFALEQGGRTTEALEGYRALCEREPPSARACYDRSRLLFESGAVEAGRTASAAFLRRFPGSALAQPAVKRLARSWADAGDEAGGIAALGILAAELAASGAGDSIDRELARLHGRAGDVAGERAALERIAARGRWGSQLWDDAVWRLCVLAREQGDASGEERQLRRLVDSFEPSRLIGTSTSPYHGRALLRLGVLRAERGFPDDALALLLQLGELETSRQRDDALFEAARIRLARSDLPGACALLARVVAIEDASAARRARSLHSEAGCGGTGD